MNMIEYVYIISLSFYGGACTEIARHNLFFFGGGGHGKCQQAFIFLTRSTCKISFSRSPHSLRDFVYFQKNTEGVQNVRLHFF